MNGAIFSWSLCIALASGASSLYLLLPIEIDISHSLRRRMAGVLAAVSALLLALFIGKPVAWWNALRPTPPSTTVLFWLLASCVLISAAAVITSGSVTRALQAYALLSASGAGLFLLYGAVYLSVAMLLLLGSGFVLFRVLSSRLPLKRGRDGPASVRLESAEHGGGDRCQEPFLACVAGALMCATLIGTIHYSLRTEAHRGGHDHRLSATPKLDVIESTRRSPSRRKQRNAGDERSGGSAGAAARRNWTVAAATAALLLAGVMGVAAVAGRTRIDSSTGNQNH